VKAEDVAQLFSLTNEYRSIRYDLHNMQALSAALGNPQNSFQSALIAGTNGKGSVAQMLSVMMPEAGLYTSPHLVRLNERIRIGPAEISDDDLQIAWNEVKAAAASAPGLLYPPTYFEMVTAMAFTYFRNRVKFAILEVGLGGRLDATNIVRQSVSVITTIDLDHQQFLGNTREEIAAEKAGIIKGIEPVITGRDVDYSSITERAGSHLVRWADTIRVVRPLGSGYFEMDVQTPVREYASLRPSLPGHHQLDNAIVAIRAAECLDCRPDEIRNGIEHAVWPGRLELFSGKPDFILDGAHNPHAAAALAAFLSEFYSHGVWMIFGTMADKKYDEMLRLLSPHVRRWIFAKPDNPRAKDPTALAGMYPGSVEFPNVRRAIEFARAEAAENDAVFICGSLYLVGEARELLRPHA
jgi:dihydrofolate synthase/folylpolyglutamate synthase